LHLNNFKPLSKLHLTLLLLSLSIAQAFPQNLGAQNVGRAANGELELRAFQKCFPDKTGEVAFIDGDWTISAGGETFFWAEGRLLPRADKDKTDIYGPHMFYMVPERPSSPDMYPPQYIETLRQRGSNESRRERRDSHKAFLGILYGGLVRTEIEPLVERIDFLGSRVSVHRDIVGALRRVEAEIRKWNGARDFIASLGSIGGYNWREIAGTQRMSYHSWGLAVDIQPRRLGGKAIYWQWERDRNENWMLIPLENRWNPPDPVIRAFEKEGFIWGGNWPFYDNMHFEYRPELHEFTRLLTANPERRATGGNAQDTHHVSPDFRLR
jgi:hypothetical protein